MPLQIMSPRAAQRETASRSLNQITIPISRSSQGHQHHLQTSLFSPSKTSRFLPSIWLYNSFRLPAQPKLTCRRALVIGGDIRVGQLLFYLLCALLEELHQLLEPVIDDGTALAGGRTDALGQAVGRPLGTSLT